MIHPISRATSYLQTFCIDKNGTHIQRSHATGFFVHVPGAILLLTNWHVLSGLDPSDPSKQMGQLPSPYYIKITVTSNTHIVELATPLYDEEMKPLWYEHQDGYNVDLAIVRLPNSLNEHFSFPDILDTEDDEEIEEIVGKDVFVAGYPFSRDELRQQFGEDTAYYLPVWKRGSIATEPKMRLARRMLLIDTLSRPGMSGAPILISENVDAMIAKSAATSKIMGRLSRGDQAALDALTEFDISDTRHFQRKRYRFLGIYSGIIGNSRLAEVALGKCWHADVVREAIEHPRQGVMEYHSPVANVHYTKFLSRVAGQLVKLDKDGNEKEKVKL